MSIVTLNPPFQWPIRPIASATPAITEFGVFLISGANDYVAFLCQAPKDMNISRIGFRTLTVTTGATVDVGIYQVNAASLPSIPGSIWNTNTNVAVVIADADDSKWIWAELDADATVSRGDYFFIKITNPSSSFGNIGFTAINSSVMFTGIPSQRYNSNPLVAPACAAFEDDGGIVYSTSMIFPFGTAAGANVFDTLTLSSSTTPDVVGVRFTNPFGFSVRVAGFNLFWALDGNGTFYLVDEDWDGTGGDALAEVVWDEDNRSGTGVLNQYLLFDTGVTIDTTTTYRLVFVPSDTTSNIVYYFNIPDSPSLASLGGLHLTTAKDPNDDTDWTNYDNGSDGYRFAAIELLIDGVDVTGSGGGGGDRSYVG